MPPLPPPGPNRPDGRALLALAAAALLAFAAWTAQSRECHSVWVYLGVYEVYPPWRDLAGVASAMRGEAAGYDPLEQYPLDPFLVALDFPRVWVALPRLLGVPPGVLDSAGPVVIGVFLASLFLVIPRPRPGETAAWAAALLSPAVLLGVERANTDLIIFPVLACALAVHRAKGGWGAWGFAGLAFLAGLFKLYPAAALAVLLRRGRRQALAAGISAGALFALYLFLIRGDLALIARHFPQPGPVSFGSRVLPLFLGYHLKNATGWDPSWFAPLLGWGGTVLAVGGAVLLARRAWKGRPVEQEAGLSGISPPMLDAFRLGAAIYLASFAMGANFDYRLVYLLPALPALLSWARDPAPGPRLLGRASLLALFPLLWLDLPIVWSGVSAGWVPYPLGNAAILAKAAASWVLFVLLAAGFLSTMPDWAGGRFFNRPGAG